MIAPLRTLALTCAVALALTACKKPEQQTPPPPEVGVIEAKADANYRQGNADARVLAEKLEAEASGAGKMGQAKADATKAMGEAEADAIGRKMTAEAEGLTGKFEAMGKMSPDARAHEEFRMQLEAALKQALASLDAGKDVSRENAEVLATALQNANIALIGGDGGVFDALTKGVSIGKALDGITGQSQVLQQLLGKLTGTAPAKLPAPDDAEA